ncbi:hypothetical protein [Marinobacter gelidimuriae]|uniref:hypothetical protein n=1 Tax=Marinobacter gelidimuriae TaxID=2739064 RepID=UPI0003AAB55E
MITGIGWVSELIGIAGGEDIPAVANNHLYEIKSPLILQPGPAALTDGLDALCEIIDRV